MQSEAASGLNLIKYKSAADTSLALSLCRNAYTDHCNACMKCKTVWLVNQHMRWEREETILVIHL